MLPVSRLGRAWLFASPLEKLNARARLPGAATFDAAAHAIRLARACGVPALELLPVALPSSWLVNSAIPSPVFRSWLSPPSKAAWLALDRALTGEPWAWSRAADATRREAVGAASALAQNGPAAGALSKVLALLFPGTVPLMPDAALAFAVGSVPAPSAPDAQTASADAFAPMMDWFNREGATIDGELESVADAHHRRERPGSPPLEAAQVLDRLVWFDSVGYRHFGGKWWPVTDGTRSAVVEVAPSDGDSPAAGGEVDLRKDDLPPEWKRAAIAALAAAA